METIGWRIELTRGEAIQVKVGSKWRNGRCLSLHEDESNGRIMVGYALDTDQTDRIYFIDMSSGHVRKWGETGEVVSQVDHDLPVAPSRPTRSTHSWLKSQRRNAKELKQWQEKAKELSGRGSEPRSPKTR